MYNMSMLRHRFSNERWGGGGGGLNDLLPLFCKSVYYVTRFNTFEMFYDVSHILKNFTFMESRTFEIAGVEDRPSPSLVKGVGTKRLGNRRVKCP